MLSGSRKQNPKIITASQSKPIIAPFEAEIQFLWLQVRLEPGNNTAVLLIHVHVEVAWFAPNPTNLILISLKLKLMQFVCDRSFFLLSIYLSIDRSICLSVCLPVYLSICLSVYLSICLSIDLSIYLSVCLSVCLFVYLLIYLSACLSVCLSVCLSIYLSVL